MVRCQLSIIIPLYQEEQLLPDFLALLDAAWPSFPKQTEVVFVDDGSTDNTQACLRTLLAKRTWQYQILVLSRNFGHQSALLAGLRHAHGEAVVTLDGDGQHPPEYIAKLWQAYKDGHDIVLTQRLDDGVESVFKRVTSAGFYSLINRLSSIPITAQGSDFRLLSRRAVDALLALPEHRQFLRGMVHWIGFSSIILPFSVSPRLRGQSKYSLAKMMRLALYGVTSFSTLPLLFAGVFSFGLFLSAFFYAMYVVYVRVATTQAVSGWASVLFVLLVVGGFLSLFLGIIGLYIAAIYDEVKRRPNYIIQEHVS